MGHWNKLKSPFLALSARGIGLLLQLGMNIILGRTLGAAGMGVYSLYTSWMMVMASVADIGMPNYALRTVSVLEGEGRQQQARHFILRVLRVLLFSGLILVLVVSVFSKRVAEWLLGGSAMAHILLLAAVAAVLFMMIKVLSESLKGIRRVNLALTAETALLPFAAILIIFYLYLQSQSLSAEGFLLIHIALLLLTTIVMLWLFHRFTRHHCLQRGIAVIPLFSQSLLPFWGGGLLGMWFMNMPILLLPQFATADEIGIFGVAYRLILLGTTILVTLASIFGPKFACNYANGDAEALKRGLKQSQLLSLLIYLPLLIAYTVFAEPVLAFFGEEFKAGKELLWIMVAGQLINTATGLVGFMMNMIHQERQEFYIQLAVTLLMLLLIVTLGHWYGVIGVAIAYATGIVVKNITSLIFSIHHLNVMVKNGNRR